MISPGILVFKEFETPLAYKCTIMKRNEFISDSGNRCLSRAVAFAQKMERYRLEANFFALWAHFLALHTHDLYGRIC